MQLNEANWTLTTLRCLIVDNSLFSVENPFAPLPLRLVILSFSIDSQWEKSYSRIFWGGTQGGGGQKCSAKGEQKISEIFFKLAYIADYEGHTGNTLSYKIVKWILNGVQFDWSISLNIVTWIFHWIQASK